MRATITKIHPLKHGPFGRFIRIEFKTEHGKWARTDVCPEHGNYQRWKNYLKVGAVLSGLKWKNQQQNMIDGDSHPTQVGFEPPPISHQQMKLL